MADHAISITNTMFAQLALTVGVAVTMVKSALHSRKLELPLVLLIASAGQFGPALVMYSNTARYTGDFYPFLIFGSILGIAALVMTDQLSVVLKRVVLDVGITAALASCFIWYILQVNRW